MGIDLKAGAVAGGEVEGNDFDESAAVHGFDIEAGLGFGAGEEESEVGAAAEFERSGDAGAGAGEEGGTGFAASADGHVGVGEVQNERAAEGGVALQGGAAGFVVHPFARISLEGVTVEGLGLHPERDAGEDRLEEGREDENVAGGTGAGGCGGVELFGAGAVALNAEQLSLAGGEQVAACEGSIKAAAIVDAEADAGGIGAEVLDFDFKPARV